MKATINIVAFLQNPWFPEDTKDPVRDRYTTDQQFHQRLLSQTMSGRRLLMSFGKDFFERIWWDNVAPAAANYASGVTATDFAHVEKVLAIQKPRLILAFGKQSREALNHVVGAMGVKIMECHHPNARFKRQRDLDQFAIGVMTWVNTQELDDNFQIDVRNRKKKK